MKIIKYMMQVLVVGSLLTSCVEDADVTAYLTEDQLSNVAQDDPICYIIISVKRALIT